MEGQHFPLQRQPTGIEGLHRCPLDSSHFFHLNDKPRYDEAIGVGYCCPLTFHR